MRRLVYLAGFCLPISLFSQSVCEPPVRAAAPPQSLPMPQAGLDRFSELLRAFIARSLPDPLYEASPGWGSMKLTTRGIKWKGSGLHVHAERVRSHENDGVWKKIHVAAIDPSHSFAVELRDLKQPEPGRITFSVHLALDVRMEYLQQNWESGFKLYDGSARARCRVKLALPCEVTARLENNGTVIPDAVFRLHVVSPTLTYDHFVMEHVAGVGGDAAKILGEALRSGLRQWHPSIERNLLLRFNAAVVRAIDNKEVRIDFSRILTNKIPFSLGDKHVKTPR